jgi:di/tricarboxylate transporter
MTDKVGVNKAFYATYVADVVAIVALVSAGALAWHGTVTATDYKDLVILCLGYVFGKQSLNA